MKQCIFLVLLVLAFSALHAQPAVGIGTTTPHASAQLDIVSTTKGVLFPRMSTSQRLLIPSPASGLMVYDNTLREFYLYDGFGWRQMIHDENNIWDRFNQTNRVYNLADSFGVGTSGPNEKLDVNGRIRTNRAMLIDDPEGILTFQNTAVDKGFVQLSGENLRLGTFSSNNTGKFVVRTNGFDRFFIDSAGNVTVGNSYKVANGYKVSVNGKIMCEEVRVQLDADWPDYVFDEGYKLMPLHELAVHIRDKKHLPGIQPASEIKENGIEVGEMNRKVVEKIEELTLYILELKKEIEILKSKQ